MVEKSARAHRTQIARTKQVATYSFFLAEGGIRSHFLSCGRTNPTLPPTPPRHMHTCKPQQIQLQISYDSETRASCDHLNLTSGPQPENPGPGIMVTHAAIPIHRNPALARERAHSRERSFRLGHHYSHNDARKCGEHLRRSTTRNSLQPHEVPGGFKFASNFQQRKLSSTVT